MSALVGIHFLLSTEPAPDKIISLNIILTFQLITTSSHVMLSNTFVLKRQNFFVGPTRAPSSSWQTAKYVRMDNVSFKRTISNIPSGCSYLERIHGLLAFLFVLLSKLL